MEYLGVVAIVISVGAVIMQAGQLKNRIESFSQYKDLTNGKLEDLEAFMYNSRPEIDRLQKFEDEIFGRLRHIEANSIALEQKLSSTITTIEADNRYVNKEVFINFQKHIDDKFIGLEKDIDDVKKTLKAILDIISKRSDSGDN